MKLVMVVLYLRIITKSKTDIITFLAVDIFSATWIEIMFPWLLPLCWYLFNSLSRASLNRWKNQSKSEIVMNTFFLKKLDIILISGAIDTPVLYFWWHLLWVSKPKWAALFALCGGVRVRLNNTPITENVSVAHPWLLYYFWLCHDLLNSVNSAKAIQGKLQ